MLAYFVCKNSVLKYLAYFVSSAVRDEGTGKSNSVVSIKVGILVSGIKE